MMPNIIIMLFLLFIILVLLAINIAIKSNFINNCKVGNLKYGGVFRSTFNNGQHTMGGVNYMNKCGLIAIFHAIRDQTDIKNITLDRIIEIGNRINNNPRSDLSDNELIRVVQEINKEYRVNLDLSLFDSNEQIKKHGFNPDVGINSRLYINDL